MLGCPRIFLSTPVQVLSLTIFTVTFDRVPGFHSTYDLCIADLQLCIPVIICLAQTTVAYKHIEEKLPASLYKYEFLLTICTGNELLSSLGKVL